ncbi:hypothetical protein Q5752_001286 [Cryptotrichosporon argae]
MQDGIDVDAAAGPSKTALILPEWDARPPKHLHASLDLISLLHLDGLYNTFVRPYMDAVASDDEGDGEGADARAEGAGEGGPNGPTPSRKRRKKAGLVKGYVGLLEDVIDPLPASVKAPPSLLPLLGDLQPPNAQHAPAAHGPPQLYAGPLEPLDSSALGVARLELGVRVEGYAGGEKAGVKEAEEKRKRKQLRLSQSVAPDLPPLSPSPYAAPLVPQSLPRRLSSTPARGVSTPGRGGIRPPFPRASAPPGVRPYQPHAGGPGTPGTPTPRLRGRGGGPPGGPGRLAGPLGTPGTPMRGGFRPRGSFSGGSGGAGPSSQTPTKRPNEGSTPGGKRMRPDEVGVKAVFKARARTEDT